MPTPTSRQAPSRGMPSAAKILSLKPDVCKIDIEAYEAAVLTKG